MALTATVTARVADLGAAPRPGWIPEVVVSVDRPALALEGTVVLPEPVAMADTGSGRLSIELIVSAELIGPVRYLAEVRWQSPAADASLTGRVLQFVVPAGGGSLGELTLVETNWGLAWEGSTPPPVSMLWLYVEPSYEPDSGRPLPVYTAPDGTTVEHGSLVEWGA